MASNLKSIADIFERRLFRIPDYQRGYSWGVRQLNDFYDDVERIMEGKNHYTGLLTIRKVDPKIEDNYGKWNEDIWLIESGFTPYYIVDGQQRVTTISLFLQAIMNRLKDGEMLAYNRKESLVEKYIRKESGPYKTYIFGYEYNDPSNKYLRANIFNDEDYAYDQTMTLYTSNLERAKDFFDEKLKNAPLGELDKIFKKLTLRLQFNLHEIDSELDEFIVFETTNNRGKPLSKLELLKNRLIYLTTIIPNYNGSESDTDFEKIKKQTRDEINHTWKKVYEYLGKNNDNRLDDDEFLRNHYYLYKGYDTDTAANVDKILLDEIFTARDAQDRKIGFDDIKTYVKSLARTSYQWFRVKNPKHESSNLSAEISEWFDKVIRQDYPPFSSCLTAALLKKTPERHLIKLAKSMERYYFLVFGLSKRKSNTGISVYYQKAHQLYTDKISGYELIEDIDDRLQSGSGHDFTLELFKNRVLKDLFNSPAKNRLGFYGWTEIKYFLYEYELHLQKDEDKKVEWNSKKNSIEHIMPQNLGRECWTTKVEGYNGDERLHLLNNLGNLLLLSEKKNSSQSNKCFQDKKQYEKDGLVKGYYNGSYSEIEVSQFNDWGPEQILDRTLDLLTFMESRWNFSIGSDFEKAKIVYLDFMYQEN